MAYRLSKPKRGRRHTLGKQIKFCFVGENVLYFQSYEVSLGCFCKSGFTFFYINCLYEGIRNEKRRLSSLNSQQRLGEKNLVVTIFFSFNIFNLVIAFLLWHRPQVRRGRRAAGGTPQTQTAGSYRQHPQPPPRRTPPRPRTATAVQPWVVAAAAPRPACRPHSSSSPSPPRTRPYSGYSMLAAPAAVG